MMPDLTPESIDTAQEWVANKVETAADVLPGSIALASLYSLKLRITETAITRVPRSVERLVGG